MVGVAIALTRREQPIFGGKDHRVMLKAECIQMFFKYCGRHIISTSGKGKGAGVARRLCNSIDLIALDPLNICLYGGSASQYVGGRGGREEGSEREGRRE